MNQLPLAVLQKSYTHHFWLDYYLTDKSKTLGYTLYLDEHAQRADRVVWARRSKKMAKQREMLDAHAELFSAFPVSCLPCQIAAISRVKLSFLAIDPISGCRYVPSPRHAAYMASSQCHLSTHVAPLSSCEHALSSADTTP
jgi:hypothetical protein